MGKEVPEWIVDDIATRTSRAAALAYDDTPGNAAADKIGAELAAGGVHCVRI